jgi:hypothetical protein
MTKKIPLTKWSVAIVDDDDFERLSKYKWMAQYNIHTNSYYASRKITINHKKETVMMAREIMNCCDKNKLIDHKNRNTLDNRKENLRECTYSENNINCGIKKNNTSGFKGVNKHANKWRAYIKYNNKQIHLGTFENIIEAALAYNKKAIELFGEFAVLNVV